VERKVEGIGKRLMATVSSGLIALIIISTIISVFIGSAMANAIMGLSLVTVAASVTAFSKEYRFQPWLLGAQFFLPSYGFIFFLVSLIAASAPGDLILSIVVLGVVAEAVLGNVIWGILKEGYGQSIKYIEECIQKAMYGPA